VEEVSQGEKRAQVGPIAITDVMNAFAATPLKYSLD
jgi:hypothetical protein